MPLAARRTFRFALVVALSLVLAYGLGTPLPFLAPLFGVLLTTAPAPPVGVKGLLTLTLVVTLTLGIGLVLAPMLRQYPLSAVLIIAVSLYLSTLLNVGLGKGLVSTLLIMGSTLIPAAGLVSQALAASVIQALIIGIFLAIISQWLIYPFFPEDSAKQGSAPPPPDAGQSNWIALRATLIVLPPVLLAFTNPSLYLPLIMKSALLAQQGSVVSARAAGRELLGSTFLAGGLAILFWFGLKLWPSLWMFFLWMLLVGLYVASKLYGVLASRFAPTFWQNVIVTLLILLGPAVEDSANGKDVYEAFIVRFALFIAVTAYAWSAIFALERLRARRLARSSSSFNTGTPRC
ncbi:DUF2955 domain-containing protein [Halomonas binhaiensis]|uniref:DUF2955 domain-containing protein n=1 Tax=Halomonas binhaiensis TaxID=2562282 RepID=A0A5C1NIU6_9GAMM|nr:DUF2955 domain-containing protein [Halomonas binhaiensis]QEM82681.1 DUF2955 domain-containing protein [Halomonas binhaiensis]